MKLGIIVVVAFFPLSYAMEPCRSPGMFPSFTQIEGEFEQIGLSQQTFADARRVVIARANEELYAQNQEVLERKGSNGKRVEFYLTEEQIEGIQKRAQEEEKRKARAAEQKAALERSEFERKVRAERVPEFTKKIIELIKKEDEEASLVQLKKWLEKQRGNLEARTVDGCTPLMVAVDDQKLSYVQLLIEHGADINAREPWTGNVLAFAVDGFHCWTFPSLNLKPAKKMVVMCRFLLSRGAQIDAKVFECANASHGARMLAFLVRYYLQVPEQQPVKNFELNAERLSNLKIAVAQANSHCWRMSYHPLEEFWYKKDFEQSVRALLNKWPLDQEPFL